MHQPNARDLQEVANEVAAEQALSRRGFMRAAMLIAVASASGIGITGCAGGGDGGPAAAPGEAQRFRHGVASGDPLADRVMLWTRVTPEIPGTLTVTWEVALDSMFAVPVAHGSATTSAESDYTVKVDAAGLSPNTAYHYRFAFAGEHSAAGRARTLPTGHVDQVRLAVFSCANFPAGYFNAYAHAAARGDIDFALHLGDYIYEYGLIGYASQLAIALDRESDPRHEIITLDDYRKRHAQYKSDPDLRALHAALPMITVWDDHDVANNAWLAGAENHDPATEGAWQARRAAAVRAFHEWLPTRTTEPANPLKIYRTFAFGDLAALHMLDTRLIGRDQQVTLPQYLEGAANGPGRQMLGAEQSAWLTQQLQSSSATWQVLGQQVLLARMMIPLSVASAFTLQTLTEFLLAQATPEESRSDQQRALVQQERVPYNLDAWDGYPAARETVLAAAKSMNKNLVSLAGDTHNAWASDLTDNTGAHVGVEFATTSVSSPGFERALPLISSVILEDAFPKMVPDLRYAELSERGYLVVTLNHTEARADFMQVSTVLSRNYEASVAMSLKAVAGEKRVVAA